MKQLIKSTYTKNGVRYDSVSSPANNGSLKQITSIEEDNGSFEYEVDGIKKKVQTEVVDNLNSIKTDVGLSANQGRVLNEKIINTDANVSVLTNQLVNKQNILTSVNEGKNITITNENGVPKINATGGGGGGTGDYDDLIHQPILKSDNTESLLPNANETIKGTINLHKVAKTGKFTDLNNITEANESQKGVIQVASDSEASAGTDTTKAINSKQLKTAIESINALQILNKGVIEATLITVQDVATQYIVAEYGRQPKTNDSLIITFTDLGNDKIQYVYSSISNLWINVGRNDIDLTDYLKKTDVVDNLTSTETQKPLSANQGKVLNEHLTTTDDEINNLTAEVSDLTTNKQDKLTTANAGTNVTITEEGGITKINAEGGSGGTSVLVGGQPQTTWNADLKQNKLVAGDNITIDEQTNTISATGGGGGDGLGSGIPATSVSTFQTSRVIWAKIPDYDRIRYEDGTKATNFSPFVIGNHIYSKPYKDANCYELKNNVLKKVDFSGASSDWTFTSGKNVFYNPLSKTYMFTVRNNNRRSTYKLSTTEERKWEYTSLSTGVSFYNANDFWFDGTKLYIDSGTDHVYSTDGVNFNKKTDNDWGINISWYGYYVWSDGNDIYLSKDSTHQYILNRDTGKWDVKNWDGVFEEYGNHIFQYKGEIYGSDKKFNRITKKWEVYPMNSSLISAYSNALWSDGQSIRCSDSYKLCEIGTKVTAGFM